MPDDTPTPRSIRLVDRTRELRVLLDEVELCEEDSNRTSVQIVLPPGLTEKSRESEPRRSLIPFGSHLSPQARKLVGFVLALISAIGAVLAALR